jgi:hypothetical protein
MHCQLDNFHLAHYYIFDWLADTLKAASGRPPHEGRL